MSAAMITDLGQLEAVYQRTEQLLQEAAEAERAAFVRWQEAYSTYEVACNDAATVRTSWARGVVP